MSLILGIESSCDETAAAIVENGMIVRSNEVASQIAKHAPYGGVIPELAAREHLTAISPVVTAAFENAGVSPHDIDAVAVTHAPGLIPALLVGIAFAKGLSATYHKPLIGINHFLAHLYGSFVGNPDRRFDDPALYPMLALIVSGGHTALVLARSDAAVQLIGSTIDDAAGEAFDKAAKMLSLGYPGGPVIEKIARGGNPLKYHFPRSLTGTAGKALAPEHRFNFSFSGLKTALLYHVRDYGGPDGISDAELRDSVASYQEAIVDVLCRKTFDAAAHYSVKTAVLCGGVACNSALRERFVESAPKNIRTIVAEKRYCTDNAAMVGGLAHWYFQARQFSSLDLDALSRTPLTLNLPFR